MSDEKDEQIMYGDGKLYNRELSPEAQEFVKKPMPDNGSQVGIGYGNTEQACKMCGTKFRLADWSKKMKVWTRAGMDEKTEPPLACEDPQCVEVLRRAMLQRRAAREALGAGKQDVCDQILNGLDAFLKEQRLKLFGEVVE